MRNRAYFFPIEYVYLPLRGERSRELNRLLSYWLSLPKVALHLHKVEGFWTLSRRWTRPIQSPTVAIAHCRSCRRKSPALHWNEWDCVALSLSVACSANGFNGAFQTWYIVLRRVLHSCQVRELYARFWASLFVKLCEKIGLRFLVLF